jgi:hypothetical protein
VALLRGICIGSSQHGKLIAQRNIDGVSARLWETVSWWISPKGDNNAGDATAD